MLSKFTIILRVVRWGEQFCTDRSKLETYKDQISEMK